MLRLLSYNIRNGKAPDGGNAWPYRKERVVSLLTLYQPDLIGLQEVLPAQLDDLCARLSTYGLCPRSGRDDDGGD